MYATSLLNLNAPSQSNSRITELHNTFAVTELSPNESKITKPDIQHSFSPSPEGFFIFHYRQEGEGGERGNYLYDEEAMWDLTP
jgi:hypothetical protein